MSEKELTKKIQNYLNTIKDCFYWKEHGGYYGTAGIPDIIVCYRGRFIAFEVKAGDNQPTALQKITIRKILKAGGYALVVKSVEEVTQVIEAFKGD
ncbi:MAG: VRR-NUC domain-containing protein [Desulfosporosinus sp.]